MYCYILGEGGEMVKKGFISALFLLLLIALPTLAQAEEIEKSLLPLDLKTTLKTTLDVQGVNESKESGLVNIGVELPIVGDVQVDLLSEKQTKSETEHTSQGNLVGLEVKNSDLLGDVKLEVIKSNKKNGEESSYSTSSLVSVDVDNALLGKTHIGVLEGNKSGSAGQENSSASLLVLDTKNSALLGDNRVGVVEYTNNNGQQKVDPVKIGNSDLIGSITDDLSVISKHPVERNDMFNNNLEAKNGVAIDQIIAGKEGSKTSLTDGIAELIGTQTPNRPVSSYQKEIAKEVYEKLIETRDISDAVITSSSIITSNSGTSPANSGLGTASGGTGLAAYLSDDSFNDLELSYVFTDETIKLSSQWEKIPPRDPPKEAFFLKA